jgi:cell division septal protein FtsQ
MAGRMPSIRRVIAALGAVAAALALVALLNGPWLRVSQVAWAGDHFTDAAELEELLAGERGASVLEVDTRALSERLERIPSVASAQVSASLTGQIHASVVEPDVAFVWDTSSARFLGAADGTMFAVLGRDAALPSGLRTLPLITDERSVARVITVGDRLPAGLLDAAMRITEIDPAVLGSRTPELTVRIDDEFGFRLISTDPSWEVTLGVYGIDPRETTGEAIARLERQVTAVRTLFASESETEIGWVDVRNPGKVYFRAKG